MYWQYTTALAGAVFAVTNPVVISNVDNAMESFIVVSPFWSLRTVSLERCIPESLMQIKVGQLSTEPTIPPAWERAAN